MGTSNIDQKVSAFYLDGKGTLYVNNPGWQKQYANSSTVSKYAWLYDYTYNCKNYGCSNQDNTEYVNSTANNYVNGYWTSTEIVYSNRYNAYVVSNQGKLDMAYVFTIDTYGIRPVITISK